MIHPSKICTFYIVRHGETDWNKEGRWQGQTDIPLNETGRRQAQELKELFSSVHFDAVFASNLARARETAEIIVEERPLSIECHPALTEINCPPLEGKLLAELSQNTVEAMHFSRKLPASEYYTYKWHPEVESQKECFDRVTRLLFERAATLEGQTVLVVSHGGIIRFLLDHFKFIPGKTWKVQNGGYIKLSLSPSGFTLEEHERIHQVD